MARRKKSAEVANDARDVHSQYNVLDLFAGCGGLSNGFEQTGRFNIVVANEYWIPAADTYERNHPRTILIRGDITKDETKNAIIEKFANIACDVIIGGPPCQAYSNAGYRNPDDPRGRLFNDYIEMVARLQPRLFVMENVKGLLTMKHAKEKLSRKEIQSLNCLRKLENERLELLLLRKRHKNNPRKFKFTKKNERRIDELAKEISLHKKSHPHLHEGVIEQIVRQFDEIGYRVVFKLLNAANYGVPQKRERVIFIGVRDTFDVDFPVPTHQQSANSQENILKWKTVREAIDDLKNAKEDPDWNHIFTRHSKDFLGKIRKTRVGQSALGFSDAFHRCNPDLPSRTVKENHGGVFIHYQKHRVMTPRELARLQSFADDFIFEGSKSQILVQIGNAVPPLLGKAIGEAVAAMLDLKKH